MQPSGRPTTCPQWTFRTKGLRSIAVKWNRPNRFVSERKLGRIRWRHYPLHRATHWLPAAGLSDRMRKASCEESREHSLLSFHLGGQPFIVIGFVIYNRRFYEVLGKWRGLDLPLEASGPPRIIARNGAIFE
jgi:hypothetical protein